MPLTLVAATEDDVPGIAALRAAASIRLTHQFGKGPWSSTGTERGVRHEMKTARVYVGKSRGRLIASLCLSTRKPWAIDVSYFRACKRPIYLTSMVVDPGRQREGVGRRCLDEVVRIAREWPADAIRLDAYDAAAGAGEFYRKCGYREVGRVTYRRAPLIYFESVL
jgi:GNAT superfamily N-acetyltransferase